MKKILIFCLLSVFLFSCSAKRKSVVLTDYSKLASELRELRARSEKRTEIYKDSLALIKGLLERSGNVTDSISHLETSYAKSDASFHGGKLYHSLENKDSIPVNIRYIRIETEVHDTLWMERTDTIYREREKTEETVVEKRRFGGSFFYASGWLAWIAVIIAGGGIWFRYKIKKNER